MVGLTDNIEDQQVNREEMLEYARQYVYAGFSVIPVGRDKKPKIESWTQYQTKQATLEQVEDWWRQYPYANIGIITGDVSGFCVFDADGTVGIESLRQYVPAGTIKSFTPNAGEHYFFICPDNTIGNSTRLMPGVDYRGNGGYVVAPPSVGLNGKKYQWQLGASVFEKDLTGTPSDLMDILNSTRLRPAKSNIVIATDMFTDGRRDTDLFTTANMLFKSGMNYTEVEQIVLRLASTCNPPFTEKEAVAKVESAMKRAQVRERNLVNEAREYIAGTVGEFNTMDLNQFLMISNKNEKIKLGKVLKKFIEDGFIERYGKRNGIYRRIINEEEVIDYINASTELVDIKWPFGIEKLVQLMPKNICVVAGTPNSGKTAFMLNLVRWNMYKHDIYYFSSEMGSTEFKSRLSKFDITLDKWKFTPVERAGDFHDVIRPDAVNIVDFLEIHEEFFKAGLFLKQIYDKLTTGVAIIALQRNKGNDAGLGGYRSLEKPRLYLNMGSNQVEIIKAKNWVQETVNPNGMRRGFKLEKGCKFIIPEPWYRLT